MGKVGRKQSYKTAGELEQAVEGYFDKISYQVPAVVSTPTGEVDEDGHMVFKTIMLTEGSAGIGRPKTVTKYLAPPNCAALCLHLGICRDTWASYGKDQKLGEVVERARLRMEAYLTEQLGEKSTQGAQFSLKCNYGWTDKRVVGFDEETRNAMAGGEMTMAEKRRLLAAAAKEFCDDGDKQA